MMRGEIDWIFKKDAAVHTEEFWYDITDGGYIIPGDLLEDKKQAEELIKAIKLVVSFENALEENQKEYYCG